MTEKDGRKDNNFFSFFFPLFVGRIVDKWRSTNRKDFPIKETRVYLSAHNPFNRKRLRSLKSHSYFMLHINIRNQHQLLVSKEKQEIEIQASYVLHSTTIFNFLRTGIMLPSRKSKQAKKISTSLDSFILKKKPLKLDDNNELACMAFLSQVNNKLSFQPL